jgi:hypothetical protein
MLTRVPSDALKDPPYASAAQRPFSIRSDGT